ncbi:hypothetical protein Ccrd_013426 [Cynara cardunculus var. scolymus]|uniref:Uncharacterized protein n=1 Tax=Cynara cardunculus var. scolymus TaxID=59895 RepID=A0A103YFM9_CYNCS|nr:hypothetical protein Ccrd_013426 [Cynara cardunculus var. scolymus]
MSNANSQNSGYRSEVQDHDLAYSGRRFILSEMQGVNGKPTPCLYAFVDVTKEIEYEELVHVKTVHSNAKPQVLTLKQDLLYSRTWEMRFDPETAMSQRKMTNKAL